VTSADGAIFLLSVIIFHWSTHSSVDCRPTKVKLVARNWQMESRFGTGEVVFR
jgi:NADH:ubiquinone oxidoreductase subunit